MEELGLKMKMESVLTDFELNIMKSIDVMLKVPIHGCFFHFKQCFQRRVERNGMKTVYENYEKFRKFINRASALSFLPIEDIEEGLAELGQKFTFEDGNVETFKKKFISYISEFWIHGCLPPRVWSTFARSEDITNNNQGNLVIL